MTDGWGRIARSLKSALLVLAAGSIAVAFVGAAYVWRVAATMPPLPLDKTASVSVTVLDRQDRLLRAFTTTDGKWRLPVEPA